MATPYTIAGRSNSSHSSGKPLGHPPFFFYAAWFIAKTKAAKTKILLDSNFRYAIV